jgi:isocitrate/isopropylmalate dehydrogenase
MSPHKIVVLGGDHCGPEVTAEALKVYLLYIHTFYSSTNRWLNLLGSQGNRTEKARDSIRHNPASSGRGK